MSSVHRQPGRPHYFCAYRGIDGKQHFKSTGTNNKAEAVLVCSKLAKAARLARKGRLTVDRVRRLVEEAAAEFLDETGAALPFSTTRQFFNSWLTQKENEGSESTLLRYRGIVARFLEFLGPRADQSISYVTSEEIAAFRDQLSAAVAAGTVNTYLKVLRVVFGRAVKRELLSKNPASLVDKLSGRDRHERRAFTMEELGKLLAIADQDWRTMILIGLYTGLRLGDIAGLDWENFDLERRELTVTTAKTGRTVIVPLAKALIRHLGTLPATDEPGAPLCPTLANYGSAWLSNQFWDLMARAKLVDARGHKEKGGKGKGPGRARRRKQSAISFHALRHTATSLLKNAGVSDAIARDIIGHESAAISRSYTHVDSDSKRKAVDAMPDVFEVREQLDLGIEVRKKR